MSNKTSFLSSRAMMAAAALFALALATPASALADDVVEAARSSGIVGEQANGTEVGLLGIRDEARADADLRRRVAQINGERRRVYFDRAARVSVDGVTVTPAEMAAATACQLFSSRVALGEWYRDEGGTWRQRTESAPVATPSFCR